MISGCLCDRHGGTGVVGEGMEEDRARGGTRFLDRPKASGHMGGRLTVRSREVDIYTHAHELDGRGVLSIARGAV